VDVHLAPVGADLICARAHDAVQGTPVAGAVGTLPLIHRR
jgi:hypothetical protein